MNEVSSDKNQLEDNTFKELRISSLKNQPGIYNHFKNNLYVTMGVSSPIVHNELKKELKCRGYDNVETVSLIYAEHTETKNDITIFILNNMLYHLEEECEEELVLYKLLYGETKLFLRTINMFLSEVDKDKYPEVTQKYRFEDVKAYEKIQSESEDTTCRDIHNNKICTNDIIKAHFNKDVYYIGIVRKGRYCYQNKGFHIGFYADWLQGIWIRQDIGYWDGQCEIIGKIDLKINPYEEIHNILS